MSLIDDTKPALVWASCLMIGTINENIHIISGIVSIGYTLYKIIKDFKNKKHD